MQQQPDGWLCISPSLLRKGDICAGFRFSLSAIHHSWHPWRLLSNGFYPLRGGRAARGAAGAAWHRGIGFKSVPKGDLPDCWPALPCLPCTRALVRLRSCKYNRTTLEIEAFTHSILKEVLEIVELPFISLAWIKKNNHKKRRGQGTLPSLHTSAETKLAYGQKK